jgi:hypothetical protein
MTPLWGRLQAALRSIAAADVTAKAKATAKRLAADLASLRSRRTGGAGDSAGHS